MGSAHLVGIVSSIVTFVIQAHPSSKYLPNSIAVVSNFVSLILANKAKNLIPLEVD
jgi:hypothetical protein